MLKVIALSVLVSSMAVGQAVGQMVGQMVGQTKNITPLTTQEASDWKEASQGVASAGQILNKQVEEKDALEKAILKAHKMVRKGTCASLSAEIIGNYILEEPFPCVSWGSGSGWIGDGHLTGSPDNTVKGWQ